MRHPHAWLLTAYNTPKQPSTARVTAWRRLHRLGALYIGPSTCLRPLALAEQQALAKVTERITTAGGGIEVFWIEAFNADSQHRLVEGFRAERDTEYAEFVEQAEALIDEVDREDKRGKFSFAEVEENEDDLAKLRRWLQAITARGHYSASGHDGAEKAAAQADQALQVFTEHSVNIHDGGGSEQSP